MSCAAKVLPSGSCHHALTALRCVLRYVRENDLMVHDPFQGIPSERMPAQEAQTETRVLRAGEVSRVISEGKGTRDVAVVTLLGDTALRTSELCGLRWRAVSLTEASIRVEGQLARHKRGEPVRTVPTKSRAGVRDVPLTPRAAKRLEALYAAERARGLGHDDDFVFTTRTGRPLSQHNVCRTVRRAGEAARLWHVTPKMLRTTVATAYAKAGV